MSEEDEEFKRISAEEFLALDLSKVTLVDLREPDELIVASIPGAINLPFSTFPKGLDDLPRDKPVVVFCGHGDFSEQVSEILADRGYDVTNVDGGFQAIREARKGQPEATGQAAAPTPQPEAPVAADAEKVAQAGTAAPARAGAPGGATGQPKVVEVDARGLKCPGPIVKVGDALRAEEEGTRFHVQATEDAFCSDIKVWCERTGNRLDSLETKDGVIDAWLTRTQDSQKAGAGERPAVAAYDAPHGKNFVVFDDDLDKVIAAFIMANGAAAMGRPVTMFFTFWGLNVLRKPEKVKVKKTFVEKMFGFMMPRGTKKLPLSHMNMGGAGPKMIRAIMKQHNITSAEDLIQSAIDHGVRIIVCQMSMEIMGIKKEELIDGLEYGGVSTFLGNAELSDMSLFI